ncbi:hypothetical protein AWC15_16695 [Mycobacterium lacus]|nr:hypothetical protein AWC15_16695 [Mycobacterium lacus]
MDDSPQHRLRTGRRIVPEMAVGLFAHDRDVTETGRSKPAPGQDVHLRRVDPVAMPDSRLLERLVVVDELPDHPEEDPRVLKRLRVVLSGSSMKHPRRLCD